MHIENRRVFATKEEILFCKNNERAFNKFLELIKSSGWLTIQSGKMARAYRKADYAEWNNLIIHGLWKTIETADDRITIPSVFRLSIWWAKTEYKKLYINKAQKTEDECDAMEMDCEGELTEIQIPDCDPRFEDIEIREFLSLMETKLTPREMSIFRETMDNGTPLRELGDSIGLSHERVRQILSKARERSIHAFAKVVNMTPKECKRAHTKKEVLNVV